MKLRNFVLLFVTVFAVSFILAGCLNEDNKIPPNCYDGFLNNGEVMVDCGGPCEACNHCLDGIWNPWEGETCVDCGGECGPCPECKNCIQDGSEVGIDCGGDCGPCAALCDDGLFNGTEEGIDCGGLYCPACPTCTDMVMNGDEIGIDCGGSDCVPCPTDGNCTNLIRDGDEFWVDCGGSICPGCDTILQWTAPGNIQHIVPATAINFSFAGGVLNVSGNSLVEGTINMQLVPPLAGWTDGAVINLNDLDGASAYVTYIDPIGEAYSTITSPAGGASGASLTVLRFRSTPTPGLVRISFSGTMKNADGSSQVSLVNGLVQVPLQ